MSKPVTFADIEGHASDNMGCFGVTGSHPLPNLDCGPGDGVERTPAEWAQDWARARGRAGAVGPPDSILPFGLLCFGMTCCMLSFYATGWASPKFLPMVLSFAVIFGGFGEFVAGILEIIKGNTFAGTVLASFGCFWSGWAVATYWGNYTAGEAGNYNDGNEVGYTLFLVLWGVLASGFFVVTLATNYCLQTVLGSVAMIFFLLAGGNYSPNCSKAGGYMAFIGGVSGVYTGLALLFKAELGWILPGLGSHAWI